MFCSAAPAGPIGNQRFHRSSGQLSDETPTSMRPAGVMLRVPFLSAGGASDGTTQNGHHSRQSRAVAHSLVPNTETVRAKEAHVETVLYRPGGSRSLSSSALHTEAQLPADASYAPRIRYHGQLSFLQEPEPNIVILTIVGTCIILILIIVGIITHYAFSKQSQVRRGAIRETRQPYGPFSAPQDWPGQSDDVVNNPMAVNSVVRLARPPSAPMAAKYPRATRGRFRPSAAAYAWGTVRT